MDQHRIKTLLGFAQKAGKIISGDNVCQARFKNIQLVILARDSSEEIKEYYYYKCAKVGTPILEMGNKVDLGLTIGKSPRAVVGIIDINFARQILNSGEKRE